MSSNWNAPKMVIKCTNCEWVGDESQLIGYYESNASIDFGELDIEYCPTCKHIDCLIDTAKQSLTNFELAILKKTMERTNKTKATLKGRK